MAPSGSWVPIRLTPAATNDLRLAFSYVEERNRIAAHALVDQLEDAVGRLAEFPQMGPLLPTDDLEHTVRFLVVAPHILFYREAGGAVVILRILHEKQDSLGMLFE